MTDTDRSRPDEEARIRALEARVAELEADLAKADERTSSMRRRLERELDRASNVARERERALGQANADLKRLRNRKSVRLALRVAGTLKSPVVAVRDTVGRLNRAARRAARRTGVRRLLRRPASGRRQLDLEAAIRASLPPVTPADGRVSIIVESRTHPAALRECLAGLEETDWADLEIIVAGPHADNHVRAATNGDQRTTSGRRRVRPVTGHSPSDSRREALTISTGELVLFLHDDVRAVDPGWLARMVATLRETSAGAVGARLLLPAGAGDPAQGAADLTVAHLGLEFAPVDGVPTPLPIGLGDAPLGPATADRVERPAATEACLLLSRATIDEVGLPTMPIDEAEPVELCLRIRALGRKVVVDGSAVLWHRHVMKEVAETPTTPGQLTDRDDKWGPALYRAVMLDRLGGHGGWSTRPLRVGITLTQDDESAGYGDWYTAHELGDALGRLGWKVSYLERHKDRWYETAPDCDVVVSLLEKFDLFRVPRHVVTVAWIRNWTEEWIAKSWFDNYDIVLVSSGRSKEIVEERSAKVAHVFPIATNPARFHPRPPADGLATDAVFVGSHWGVDRGVAAALPELAAAGHRVRVFGRGWESLPGVSELSQGLIDYDRIPDAYAASALAIDDAAVSTKPYGSVNSRVFDALATGTLVVTDNEIGVRELFDDDFPTWHDAEDLVEVVGRLLDQPERRAALADRYRTIVLERHTYDHRAAELRSILAEWASATKIAVHIGPQTWEMGATWGDVPYGRDIQRNLERRGHPAAVLVHDEQTSAASLRADIAIHVFGVRAAATIGAQVKALWVISHPDRVTESLCESYDVVFVASDLLLEDLSRRTEVPVMRLHQATEPARFYPDPTGPHHELLFVGNSRGVQRPVIEDLRDTPWDLAVYGGGWTSEMLDPRHLKGEWIPNEALRTYYSSADIVLNDHWSDMRELGIISNRVYDALACGAFVVSDRVPGIEEEFDGAVATYETRDELLGIIQRYLEDPVARRAAADRGRAAVISRHTFGHRVETMLDVIRPLAAERSQEVDLLGR